MNKNLKQLSKEEAALEICRSKVRFPNKVRAWSSSVYSFIQYGAYMTPYSCRICSKIHLTGRRANPKPSLQFIREFNKWYGAEILNEGDEIIQEYATRSNINSQLDPK